MSGLVLMAFLSLETPVNAQPSDPLVTTFAACTGRFSALMEYGWLVGNADPAVTAERAMMIDLLDAVTPVQDRRDALAHRIDVKAAHWALLTRATFNDDPDDAEWAMTRAEAQIAACRSLVIS